MTKLGSLFLYIVFFILWNIQKIVCQLTTYEIYESNNSYPRPVLLEGNDVLALSGKTTGYMIKYNSNAEVILERKALFEYDSNADIKQLKGTDKRYVIVSGGLTQLSIKLFDDNVNVFTTTTSHYTNSYKISLLPLINGDILIGWVHRENEKQIQIYIAKYALNGNTFVEKKITNWGTDNYYISCVEVESNNAIVCQYVSGECDETYKVFTSDLGEKETNSIYKQIECGFDKILYLGEDRVAATYLFSDSLYVKIYNHTNYSLALTIEHTKIMNGCTVNTMKTDTTVFSNKKIIGTCISKDNYAQVAIVDVGTTSVSSRSFKCSGTNADYPFASKFGGGFLSIFYHSDGNNVYEILEMPNCVGFETTLYINSETSSFSMEKGTYIIQGIGDTSYVLNVIYPELPTEGKVYFVANNTEIEADKIYEIPKLKYVASSTPGIYTLKFAGTNSENKKGKWCWAKFIVEACYEGCYTCFQVGTANDNKCDGCLQNYYPVTGIPGSCVKDKPHYYVNYTDNPKGVWKPCFTTCNTCSKDFTTTENNCDSCLTGYYPVDGDTTGKCTNQLPEGYYLDETDLNNKIYRKCYDTCLTCLVTGTQDDNKCETCKTNNYKFEGISGKCDSTDTSPNHNYYKDDSDSSNIIWKKCYISCASCSTGGDNSNNNCDSCASGYKLIEGTTQCTNSLPEYHYETDTMYKKCNDACKTCNGEPLTTPKQTTNCILCREDLGYYPLSTDSTNCLNSAPEGYYKDTSSTDITYKECYSSCKTCSTAGNVLTNNCNECKNGYYPYDGVTGSCVQNPSGYYFDSNSNSYKQCNQACKKCNGASTSTSTNCVIGQCKDTYYGVASDQTNCLNSPPQYYFLDQSSTPNLYKQCYSECNTCNGVGSSTDFQCVSCKTNGYKMENTNNCYYSTPENYFLDGNVYKKCYDTCKICTGVGDATDHKCSDCKDTYKKIMDTNNCVNSLPQYYYETSTEYRPCYGTCATCSADGTSSNHNCDTCRGTNKFLDGTKNCLDSAPPHHYLDSDKFKPCDPSCDTCNIGGATNCQSCLYSSNYYPMTGTVPPYQCYSTKPAENYYLDTTAKEYKLCYTTCKTCSAEGNENDNNCDSCPTDYYPFDGKPKSCTKNPQYYYFDGGVYKECYLSCKTCSTGGTKDKNNCIVCKDGTTPQKNNTDITYNCVSSCKDNKKFYGNTCEYCPEGTAVKGEHCVNCKLSQQYKLQDDIICDITSCNERECVGTVPEGYYSADSTLNYYKKCSTNCKTCETNEDHCLSCPDATPIFHQNKCYTTCPDDGAGNRLYELPDKTCTNQCPNYLFIDAVNYKCLPCDPDYKNINKNICYAENNLPEGSFKLSNPYKSFDICYNTCSECSEISTDANNQKCTKCKNGFYLTDLTAPSNCVNDCGDFLVKGTSTSGLAACINCKTYYSPSQYKNKDDNTQCFSSLPTNSLIVDTGSNTFQYCFTNCATCNAISDDIQNQKCITCNSITYKDYTSSNCIDKCGQFYVHNNVSRTCDNCNKDYGQYKFIDKDECTTSNSGSYPIDTNTGTIGTCHSNCETCEKGPENNDSVHNCKTCKDTFFLQEDGKNCETFCPDYLVSKERKCINCKNDLTPGGAPQYKFLNENFCRDTIPQGAYKINDTYNILSYCYTGCKTCSEVGDANDNKCETCADSYYKEIGTNNCVKKCDDLYAQANGSCINCANQGEKHIKGETTCTSNIDKTFLVDSGTQTYDRCYDLCLECYGKGDSTNNNCKKCDGNYFLENKDSKQCVDQCDLKLVPDAASGICINCKTHLTNKEQYKDPITNTCTDTIRNGYYVDDLNYNTLAKCHDNCVTCTGAGTDSVQNCLTCVSAKYKDPDSTNCIDNCLPNYAIDISNPSDKKCINCKKNSPPLYKYENDDICIPRPSNSYVKNPTYNLIEDCDISCSTCSNNVKCDTCASDYIWHPMNPNLCIKECDLTSKLWYIDENNEYKCTIDNTCTLLTDKKIIEDNTKQCVKNCDSDFSISSCIECTKTNVYEYEGKCLKQCPTGYEPNQATKKCVIAQDDGSCKVNLNNLNENTLSTLTSVVDEQIGKYLTSFSSSSQNNVNIIKTPLYIIHLFKSDECEFQSSAGYLLTYINFTECRNKIHDSNQVLNIDDILFVKVDLNRTGQTNQIAYDAYDISNGNKLDLTVCSNIVINYPLSNKINLNLAENMYLQGIDVFNSSDPFFNDFCYPFISEDGKDVLMMDRRKDYYQENALCEQGCNYTKINFQTAMVECDCEEKGNKGIDTVNSILENIPLESFTGSINTNNIIVVRCYNLVFDLRYMKKNYGTWIMLGLFICQLPGMFNFIFVGLSGLYAYLNSISSQKQMELIKEKEGESGEENEEESEEDDSNRGKPNPPKKISKGINNYDMDTEPNDTPEAFIKKGNVAKLPIFDLKNPSTPAPVSGVEITESTKKMIPNEKIKAKYMHMAKESTENCNNEEEENQNVESFDDDELDELVFEDAIQYDNRGICKFFGRCLTLKIVFLSPFANISVFEPLCIKLTAFFLNLAMYLVLNALLFDEEYIQKRYEETGDTGFLYLLKNEISKCIYASLASTVIGFLLLYLTNSKKRFKTAIDTEKEPAPFIKKTKEIISSLRCKMISFFIINLILMCAFWYYISAFCSVYQKTQVPWLEGCAITFAFCVILQVFYSMLITFVRYIGLKCKISCFYTLSTYLI